MKLTLFKRILVSVMACASIFMGVALSAAPAYATGTCSRSQATCFWSGINESFNICNVPNGGSHSVWFYIPNVCGFTAKSMQEFGTSSVWLYDKAANTAICIKANGSDSNTGGAYGYAYIKYNTACGANPP